MADVMVSAIVKEVVSRLASEVDQEFRLLRGLNRAILDLQSKFSSIQAVLEDAEAKQSKNLAIQDWLRNLRAVSFEMENILDDVSAEAISRRVDIEIGKKNRLSRCLFTCNRVAFRSRIAHRVEKIQRRLTAIAEERSMFELKEGVSEDKGDVGDLGSRLTSSLVNELEIVGRDVEKKMIIEKICDVNLVNYHDDVLVYAIWGMGGVGKTTLSQLVYNHQSVTEHFNLKMWVCVSDDFDVLRLIKAILESIEGKPCTHSQLDAVQRSLKENIQGKRFLLVLDDIWNQERTEWDRLKEGLKYGASGSVVMVTTRIRNIACMMAKRPEFIHEIGCLPEEESRSFFNRLAFGAGRTGGNVKELEPIGDEIADKCKGLPLALKALGSLMWSKDSVSEWLSVLERDLWDLREDEGSILPALKISYDNLPRHYKQCFAYCCLVPKDSRIIKDLMIQLWIAHKFIPSRGEEDLYTHGEEIFKGLLWRSFFQDVEEETWEGVVEVTCKMHDLMHDLAQSVAGHECSLTEGDKEMKLSAEVLHGSSLYRLPTNEDLVNLTSLRSVLLLNRYAVIDSPCNQIFNQRYLRALTLKGLKSAELPESVCNLKQLRRLSLYSSWIEVLPESIIYLQNLQFLNLCDCERLRKLPRGMRHMKNLQFLKMEGCKSLEEMPSGMGQLVGLRRLSKFVVGKTKHGRGIGELGELNLLEKKLQIERLQEVIGLEEAKRAKLNCKQYLISLTLEWSYRKPGENGEEVVEGLEPHSNLKVLKIIGYSGLKLGSWMINLVNLEELELSCCQKLEILPRLGKLPLLRFLKILMLHDLRSFHDDDNNTSLSSSSSSGAMILFPCLQELVIEYCNKLILLPSDLPKLEELYILGCNELVSLLDKMEMEMGCYSSLSRLSIKFCQKLKCLLHGPQNLLALKSLTIENCDELIQLPSDLPKLEELHISGCKELVSLPEEMGMGGYSLLSSLHISDCPKLKFLPDGPQNLQALKSLILWYCEGLIRLPYDLPKLEELYINNCKELVSLPQEMGMGTYSLLSSLSIKFCQKLKCLMDGPQNLLALKSLTIENCDELIQLPSDLPKLEELDKSGCKELVSLPEEMGMGGYSLLSHLHISDCPKLKFLPDGPQNLQALKSLMLWDCEGLIQLPYDLPKLEKLRITGCKELVSLPQEY